MASESQINANRANAQHSTGPSSPEGKLKSSHNAVKTGLTGRTILLPSDDLGAYENFVEILKRKYQPVEAYEKHLVQKYRRYRMALTPHSHSRIRLSLLGRHELAGECAHEPNEQVRAAMLEAFIDRSYKKDLRNLALQERRLRAQLAKFVEELTNIQEERDAVQFQRRNRVMNPVTRTLGFKRPDNMVDNLASNLPMNFSTPAWKPTTTAEIQRSNNWTALGKLCCAKKPPKRRRTSLALYNPYPNCA